MTERQQIEAHYREAVSLADQARGWFDGPGAAWRHSLSPAGQAEVAVESLAITARLMAAMSWLLHPGHTPELTDNVPKPAAFVPRREPELPADSVLQAVIGGKIALESRALAARMAAL